ncbi:DNA helicase RecQ [Sulfurospirillum sp. 1612]|uniref:DNA helicase RecQ n=1 Tax=Sulfurospirillum sp. 1612 TaxID=3094835 RepID=UPI002F92CF9E
MHQFFGFNEFKPLQKKSIEAILSKRDLLTILPTGGGKSLCYQLPAIMQKSELTIVISPLIALINDQIINLRNNNIQADKLTSELNEHQMQEVYEKIRNKQISLLYVSPERAVMGSFKQLLRHNAVSFIVIDEAHCVSEWGHEFRFDYRKLHYLKEEFPHIPIAAFTATATDLVAKDIIKSLKLNNPVLLKGSFFRKNLLLSAKKRQGNGRVTLLKFLEAYQNESGIIYTFTRKESEALALFLQSKHLKAKAYHAGISSEERHAIQSAFIKDETKIIVATIAFGMGIDKSNVRFVVHMDLPKSIESYYQEIGRAGRDGLKSACLLLYSRGDVTRKSELLESIEDERYKNLAKNKIEALYHYASATQCRHKILVNYFEEEMEDCLSSCDNCKKEPHEAIDITREAQMFLSAMYRSNQSFGHAYIIDILRGARGKKLLDNHHDTLSVYGIGKSISKQSWELIVDALFEHNAIKRGEYRELLITSRGRDILKGSAKVSVRDEIFASEKEDNLNQEVTIKDENFEALRALRTKIAKEINLPAYVVFSDATLKEMAQKLPHDSDALLQINGVGPSKLEKYGTQFLQKIQEIRTHHEKE